MHHNLDQKRKEERKWFPFYINIPIAVWVDGWRGPRIGHFSHFFVPLILFSSCVYFLILPIFFFVLPSSWSIGTWWILPKSHHVTSLQKKMENGGISGSILVFFVLSCRTFRERWRRINRFPLFLETSQRSNLLVRHFELQRVVIKTNGKKFCSAIFQNDDGEIVECRIIPPTKQAV